MIQFPPADPSVSQQLPNLESFGAAFKSHSATLKERFFKYERIQVYQEPGNKSWEAYNRGDLSAAWDKLGDFIAQDRDLFVAICQKDIPMVRVRAVELPLSHYLKWEFRSYPVTCRWGSRILIVDLTGKERDRELWNSSDFILFDRRSVLVHNYDRSGILQGGWVVEAPAAVQAYVAFAKRLVSMAVPLAMFESMGGR